jgi:small subunit ribosomal protein S17e
MGRIKTQFVKRTSQELVKKHETHFSDDFEANKRAVSSLTDVSSKKVRNIVAGYITRLVKNKKEF